MPAPRGLIQRVDQELHRTGLLPRGGRLLVAVSGGADSVGLLRLLHAINGSDYWGWTLVVGHVDHGIRGAASGAADATFVRGLAKELGLVCRVKRLRLGKGASEGAARKGRLRALREMAKRQRCVGAVTAHHADDQAETVMLRLMRGCGLEGLAAMGGKSVVDGLTLYRPLLGVRSKAIRAYLTGIEQGWREDETNGTDTYLRNRVRAEILPAMEAVSGGAVEALVRMSQLAGAAQEVIDQGVQEFLAAASATRGRRRVVLQRAVMREGASYLCGEALRAVVAAVGGSTETADFERVQEAVRIVRGEAGGKTVELGRGVVMRVGGGKVVVERGAL